MTDKLHDWTDVVVTLDGKPLVGITEIEYTTPLIKAATQATRRYTITAAITVQRMRQLYKILNGIYKPRRRKHSPHRSNRTRKKQRLTRLQRRAKRQSKKRKPC